jgi:DUF4097 and DUF4098 domain-containing protein YvlB
MKKMLSTAAFIAASGLSICCGGKGMKLVSEQEVSLEDVTGIEILYQSVDVTLRTSSTSSLVIEEYMSEDKEEYHAEVTKSGGKLTIRQGDTPAPRPFWPFRARVEVYLPSLSGKSLRVKTASGNIVADEEYTCGQAAIESTSGRVFIDAITADAVSIQATSGAILCMHVKGTADIRATSGSIVLDRADGKASIEAKSGNIKVGQVTGESVSIMATSGSVTCENVEGNADIRTTSGSIRLSKVGGSVYAKATSGTITCEAAGGSMAIRTTSGAIQAATTGKVERIQLTSTSGRIDLAVPGSSNFNFSARTVSGSLSTPFPEKLSRPLSDEGLAQGTVGDADSGNSVNVKTTSGSIKVRWID